MAEAGNPLNVFNIHMEEGGTFIAGDYVRKKSEITVFQGPDAENNDGDVVNDAAGRTESDKCQTEQERRVSRPNSDDKDLTWLVKGKIVLYKKHHLSKTAKTVFYGRQQLASDYWREIAIKVIQSEKKNLSELRLLMKLRHPNIVQLIDAIEKPGHAADYIFIVMELCSQNLRNYVEENDFNFQNLFSFIRQIVEGLIYLHDSNVAHRDLKPDNVLISFCKKFAKLSDFGLSREIPEGRSKVTVTTIGAGTEGYRAPETYQDIPRVSPSIDIFPFGLVTHFTFTNGKHPFGSNPYELAANIMKSKHRDLTKIPHFEKPYAHKRKQLMNLLHQTLQTNPSDRPTMKEIKQSSFIADGVYIPKEPVNVPTEKKTIFTPIKNMFRKDSSKHQTGFSNDSLHEVVEENTGNSIKFVAVIHAGKFASLHKGYWKRRLVTIKKYENSERVSFDRELRSLTVLKHENVIDLVEKISGKPPCLVFEYLEGGILLDYLRRVGSVALSFLDRLDMILQIASGLTFVSNMKFIHGDLQAENIFVGHPGVYKISGFHLSRTDSDNDKLGFSIRWSAPEVLSDGAVSTKSDVWSFGILLYEIFTNGAEPYRDLADTDVKDKVLSGYRLPRPSGCPENVYKMMSQCWADDRKDRPRFDELQSCKNEVSRSPEDGAQDMEDESYKIEVERMKQIQEIKDELKKPVDVMGFPSFAQLLSELREFEGSDDLDILLHMAECELQLGRGKEEDTILRTKNFISSSGLYSVRELCRMAYELRMSKCYVRSLILYRIFTDLHKSQNLSPDDAVEWIRNRVVNISNAVQPLLKAGGSSRDIGIKYGLLFMEALLKNLRAIDNATSDVRTLNEADCLCSITFTCNIAGKYQKSITFGSQGVKILDKQFGTNALKHKIYGNIVNNLGTAQCSFGRYSDAERYYIRALEAHEKALDFENEGEKLVSVDGTKQSLEIARRLLSKQK